MDPEPSDAPKGLAARLREAGDADPQAIARARSAKAGLAERMQALAGGEGAIDADVVAVRGADAPRATEASTASGASAPAGATRLEADDAQAMQSFAQRLRSAGAPAAAAAQVRFEGPARPRSAPPATAGEPVAAAGVPAAAVPFPAPGAGEAAPQPALAGFGAPSAEPTARTRMLRWFLGREEQVAGEGPVTPIPPLPEGWDEVDFYDLDPPYAFVRIVRNQSTGQLRYEAIEPALSEREQKTFDFVQDALVRGLNVDPGPLRADQREEYLVAAVRQILGIRLAQARNPLVPSVYLATVYGQTAIAAVIALVPLLLGLAIAGPAALGVRWLVPLVALPVLLGVITYGWGMLRPDLEAKSRRRDIEAHLPYALNFMAALASAGVVPVEVFGALGSQKVYGEMAREANLVYRDTRLFSKDLVSALQAAGRRSPSQQLEEFFQGAVSTITSGGDLTNYLLAKSDQFAQENRREQKAFLESLGVMAESYVVVAAAAPLFLMVILSVMMLMSQGLDPTLMLNLLVLVALPVIHSMFAWILSTMRPD